MSHALAFQPTPVQRRLLDFIHEHPSFHTIHELCDATGIGRTTYYRWCQSPEFRLWLAQAWSARLLMDGIVLLNIARVGATRSFSYWKALAELTFDPRGLGALQKWQQALAQAENDAFASDEPVAPTEPPAPPQADEPQTEPESPKIPPGNIPPPPQSNQPLTPGNGTKQPLWSPLYHPPKRPHGYRAKIAYPHHSARLFCRVLARCQR